MEMGRVWNQELDEEQKAPFHAQRQQLVVKWKKAIEAYRQGNDKKGPEDELEGAHVVEKGDMSSKEKQKDVEMGVEKDEQGKEITEVDGWRWTEGNGDTEMKKVEHCEEVKEEGGKGGEDMEIDGGEKDLEVGDAKGEMGY